MDEFRERTGNGHHEYEDLQQETDVIRYGGIVVSLLWFWRLVRRNGWILFVLDHLVYLRQFERGQYPIRHAIGVHLPHDEHVLVTFHGDDFQIHIPVRQGIEVYYIQNAGQRCSSSLASLRSDSCLCAASDLRSWPTTVWLLRRALSCTEYRWLFSANRRWFRWDSVAACCMQLEVGSPCGWFTLWTLQVICWKKGDFYDTDMYARSPL